MSVETRASPLFRGMLEAGVLPNVIDETDLRATLDLDVPAKIGEKKINAVMDFVTPGRGAFDAKKQFLDKEDRLFRNDNSAIEEREDSVKALNEAIYETLYGGRDQALLRPVSRALRLGSENAAPLLEVTDKLLSYIGVEIYTGPGADEAVEASLTSLDLEAPSVIRRFGMLASASDASESNISHSRSRLGFSRPKSGNTLVKSLWTKLHDTYPQATRK